MLKQSGLFCSRFSTTTTKKGSTHVSTHKTMWMPNPSMFSSYCCQDTTTLKEEIFCVESVGRFLRYFMYGWCIGDWKICGKNFYGDGCDFLVLSFWEILTQSGLKLNKFYIKPQEFIYPISIRSRLIPAF